MRVLQVHNEYLQSGGEDAVVEHERDLLRASGHEVVTYRTRNPAHRLTAVRDLALSPWNPFQARRLERFAREMRPDVVHVHNTWYHLSPAVFPALRRSGAPVVLTLHNYRTVCPAYTLYRDGAPCERCLVSKRTTDAVRFGCYRGSRLQSVAPAATVALARHRRTWELDVDALVCLTDFARERFIAGGLPSETLHVKPNSVPDPGARPSPPSESRTLLFVGRLSPEKGIEELLEAWSVATRQDAIGDLELHVIGDGPLRPVVEAASNITYRGWLPSEIVRAEMRAARALVFPSRWYEGFPVTLVEAMATGLPVIASELGAMPSILGPDRPRGFGPNARDIANALPLLLDDTVIDRTGQAMRARYLTDYSESVAAARLVEIYELARQHRQLQR